MFDLDPRDYDSRDNERCGSNQSRGSLGASDDRDRDDDWNQPYIGSRDRDGDARTLGRSPGSDRQDSNEHARDRRDNARWPERDRKTIGRIGRLGVSITLVLSPYANSVRAVP